MKEIYIIITQTGTILSRLVKLITNREYNHVSIGIDNTLKTMYSFGRLNPYNPFWGGFVIEGKNIGTFKRFKNTKCKVFSLEVTSEQYELIINNIEFINKNKNNYKFNVLGLLLAGLNKHTPSFNSFYCSEFVKHILEKSNIDVSIVPEIPLPMSFADLHGNKLIYEGLLREYK